MIFSCAYALSMNKKYINPALLILAEIILVSINSYLGESSMLSLSSYYEKSELKFWSIGTGLASLFGTGLFLVMNLWLNERVIFGINLMIYIFGLSLGLYFLDFQNKILSVEQLRENNNQNVFETQISENINVVPIEEFDLTNDDDRSVATTQGATLQGATEVIYSTSNLLNLNDDPKDLDIDTEKESISIQNGEIQPSIQKTNILKKNFKFFTQIYPIILAYFYAYLFAFGYVPLLVRNNLDYQITQVITRTCLFLGRTIGNFIHVERIKLFGLLHLYNFVCLIFFTIIISINTIHLPIFIVDLLFVFGYFLNGISYPIVYQYIQELSRRKRMVYGFRGTIYIFLYNCWMYDWIYNRSLGKKINHLFVK